MNQVMRHVQTKELYLWNPEDNVGNLITTIRPLVDTVDAKVTLTLQQFNLEFENVDAEVKDDKKVQWYILAKEISGPAMTNAINETLDSDSIIIHFTSGFTLVHCSSIGMNLPIDQFMLVMDIPKDANEIEKIEQIALKTLTQEQRFYLSINFVVYCHYKAIQQLGICLPCIAAGGLCKFCKFVNMSKELTMELK